MILFFSNFLLRLDCSSNRCCFRPYLSNFFLRHVSFWRCRPNYYILSLFIRWVHRSWTVTHKASCSAWTLNNRVLLRSEQIRITGYQGRIVKSRGRARILPSYFSIYVSIVNRFSRQRSSRIPQWSHTGRNTLTLLALRMVFRRVRNHWGEVWSSFSAVLGWSEWIVCAEFKLLKESGCASFFFAYALLPG